MGPKRKRYRGKKKKAIEVDPDDERHFELKVLSRKNGKSRIVKVKPWQGEIRVDIRKYFESNGKDTPTVKGISLKVDEGVWVRSTRQLIKACSTTPAEWPFFTLAKKLLQLL